MKKCNFFSFILLLILAFNSGNLLADVKLPALFTDHMVLQQQAEVMFWGKASNNATVKVLTSWDQKAYQTKAEKDGNWKLKVKTPKAGGPYNISISDGKTIKINDVLIGEVWLCSGQSNMEMPVKGFRNQPVLGSAEAIALSSNPQIRLFSVSRNKSLQPLDDVNTNWKYCEPENVANYSATAYFFGLMLQKSLKVPIGLIQTSWGGTRIEPWVSEMGIKNFDFVKLPNRDTTGEFSQQTPTVLFNAMVNPLVGYGIRGAIWYQGESNKNDPKTYEKLLPGLIQNWRNLWNIGDFPFYYMQIAPYVYGKGVNSAFLREAQLKASTVLPNVGMASILDIGQKETIHPSHKKIGADRLALLALEKTYRVKGIQAGNPTFKEMTISNGIAKLKFDNAPLGLNSADQTSSNFEIAGADHKFYPAKAIITKEGVSVSSSSVKEPVAVRYAFKDFVVGDLFGSNGFPVSSFRTDDWDDAQ
nr:sialate O-acetylesterase [uncultured Pedobacter sp.]